MFSRLHISRYRFLNYNKLYGFRVAPHDSVIGQGGEIGLVYSGFRNFNGFHAIVSMVGRRLKFGSTAGCRLSRLAFIHTGICCLLLDVIIFFIQSLNLGCLSEIKEKNMVSVGNVPVEVGVIFFLAILPAIMSAGIITPKRPKSMHIPKRKL